LVFWLLVLLVYCCWTVLLCFVEAHGWWVWGFSCFCSARVRRLFSSVSWSFWQLQRVCVVWHCVIGCRCVIVHELLFSYL
jgi:hypothetical protein